MTENENNIQPIFIRCKNINTGEDELVNINNVITVSRHFRDERNDIFKTADGESHEVAGYSCDKIPESMIIDLDSECFYPKAEDVSLEDLQLSTAAYNCMKHQGEETLADILRYNKRGFNSIRGLGQKRQREIIDKVHQLGFMMSWE